MKRSLLLAFLTANCILLAGQVPEFFNYQAIVRNVAGQPVVSQTVSILFTIIKTNPSGTNVYSEKHSPVTNEFGLVTLAIGNGSDKSGDFTTIDWSTDNYFLNVKIDPSGGSTYTDMGTTQLLSVPYAMHAKSVANNDDADADPENELQDLTIVGFNLGITGGDGVTIPSLWAEDGGGIKYDGGKVLITRLNPTGSAQLELADIFDPGGKNLIIGDNAFLTDIDQDNSLGIYGLNDPYEAAINLGIDGPVLSKGFSVPFPGILDIKSGSIPPLGGIRFGLVGPTISNFYNPEILIINNGSDIESGTIKLGDSGPTLTGTTENLSIDKKLNMNNLAVENVSDPVNSQDAATKAYVDEIKTLLFITTDASKLLDAGVTVPELLNAGVSVANLVAAGASAADLLAAGVSVADLLASGVSVADLLAAGVSVADLLAAGVSVADLLAADANVADLLAAGVSVTDLFNAGVGVGSLEQNGVTEQELTDAGLIGTVTDAGGNEYKWVKIGTQIWMAENLKYLPSVVGPGTQSPTVPNFYVYGYTGTDVNAAKATANYTTYGVEYNWPAALTSCPTDWHLPDDDEWKNLEMFLGMSQAEADGTLHRGTNEGSKLAGNAALWVLGQLETNQEFGSSGFAALPGGHRDIGQFWQIELKGSWWSATESGDMAWGRVLDHFISSVSRESPFKTRGYSVRCIKSDLPLGETKAATSVASNSATLNGTINTFGKSTTVTFQYGTTTSYGSEITALQSPVLSTESVEINASLTSLNPEITYHFRVKAVNTWGTTYGSDMTFITPARVTDAGGNEYNTVIIGTQTWMAENLRYLPSVAGSTTGSETAPYYYVYGYEGTDVNIAKAAANYNTYGVLYNWPAAMASCPTGWHLPSDADLKQQEIALGMSLSEANSDNQYRGTNEGSKLAGNEALWLAGALENDPGFGSSGFKTLPGGYRDYSEPGSFQNIGKFGHRWSSTSYNSTQAWYRDIQNDECGIWRGYYNKGSGFSVRCLKD